MPNKAERLLRNLAQRLERDTEGSQATSSATCRPGSAPDKKLNPRRASLGVLVVFSAIEISQCHPLKAPCPQ